MKAHNLLYVLFCVSLLFVMGCKKPKDVPNVKTVEVKIIPQQSQLALDLTGAIISDGNDVINTTGFCLSQEPDPSLSDINIVSTSRENDKFSAKVFNLEDGNYYVRAYAINGQGLAYGEVISVGESSLAQVDIVKVETASLPTLATAVITGRLLSNGGAAITQIGVCLSKQPEPTISDTVSSANLQANSIFLANFDNLDNNSKYYIRAFVKNSQGTAYGEQLVLETISKPLAENMAPANLRTDKAILQAMVYPKNTTCQFYFEYGISPDFGQQTEIITVSGKDGVELAVPVADLIPGEIYYFRTKVSNLVGESISPSDNFETYGLEDIDGNLYHTVKIGNQVWMRENLKVTHYNDGTPIRHITNINEWRDDTQGAYCFYNNNNTLQLTYGNLYNFLVIENHPGKLAPIGWHVPTDEEWFALAEFLSGDSLEINDVGGLMKEEGYSHWLEPNYGATNISGFTALPGGYAFHGYWLASKINYYWTSTAESDQGAYCRMLQYEYSYLTDYIVAYKSAGFSIRLIKD